MNLTRDVRIATRVLARSRSFTCIAIVSLALAMGATTAIFSFVRAIVLMKLPVAGAGRLVLLRQQNEMFHIENCCFLYPFFRELRKNDAGFEDVLSVAPTEVTVTDGEQTEKLHAEVVSGNYFRMLGVRPAAGRLLDENDDASVCVIGHRLWQERFGGRDVIGRRVTINGEPFQIVGVTERGFTGASLHEPRELQIPASTTARESSWPQLIARLKPGVSAAQAQARLNVTGRRIEKVTGPHMSERDDFMLRDGSQGLSAKKEEFGRPVMLLLLLVGVVLLVACANLSALLLVRSVERTPEAGLRMALGASRWALARQFLVESLLLATGGGVAGWALSHVIIDLLLKLLGTGGDGLDRYVRPDAVVFAFCAAITITAGILFGMLPAWRATRCDPLPAIRGVSEVAPGRRSFSSQLLIAGQIALSLALLFGAGLFARTLRNLRSIDLGFQPENVALMHVNLDRTAHAGKAAQPFFEELLRQVRALPETRAASLAGISVLSGSMASTRIDIPGYVPPNRVAPVTYFMAISGGYFRTLGVPLLAGRDFTDADSGAGEGAVLVNEQFARQYLGGDALGKTFSFGGGRKVRVAGLAGTTRFRWLRESPQPVMYLPVTQWTYPQSLYLQVRTSGEPGRAIERMRGVLRGLDPHVPPGTITTMEMQIDQTLARERLLSFLSTLMGALAVVLAAIGLYGVLSFSVARRTREIGIRMAVGAPRGLILRMFLRESMWMVIGGIALGIPLAIGCGRLAQALLYGLQPADALTALAATVLLGLVATGAALIPAWRASRMDAMAALRYE